jgi:hypothetical protein
MSLIQPLSYTLKLHNFNNNLGPNPVLQELYVCDDKENIGNNKVASFLLQVGTKK